MTMETAGTEDRAPASIRLEKPRTVASQAQPVSRDGGGFEGYGYLCWLGSLGFADPARSGPHGGK